MEPGDGKSSAKESDEGSSKNGGAVNLSAQLAHKVFVPLLL